MTKKFSVGLLSFMIMLSLLAPVVNANDFTPNSDTTKDAEVKADAVAKPNTEAPKTVFDDEQGDGIEIGSEIVPEAVGALKVDKRLNLNIAPPSINPKTVSGTGVAQSSRRSKQGDVTITVIVSYIADGEKVTKMLEIKKDAKLDRSGPWSVSLNRELHKDDVVTSRKP